MSGTKTVLVIVGEDIILRNIFETDFKEELMRECKGVEARFVYVTSPELYERCRQVLGADANILTLDHIRPARLFSLVMFLSRNALRTHTNEWERKRAYADGRSSFVGMLAKSTFSLCAGNSSFIKRLLRSLFIMLPSDSKVSKLFSSAKPDIVVSLCLVRFDFDVPIAREAKKRRIFLIGMVRSWDNLTSHGLLNVPPDVFFFQNAFLADAAKRYQAIMPGEQDQVVGVPHYDHYFEPQRTVLSRQELFDYVGLDNSKKLILYGAMGEFLFVRESDMIDVFRDALHSHELSNAQVLFRAHPSFTPPAAYVSDPRIRVFIPSGFTGADKGISSSRLLMSMIYHADLVVTCGSTFGIDSVVLNKPLICIGFDGHHQETYWRSAARFYDSYTHYEAFMEVGNIALARSEKELEGLMIEYLKSDTTNSVCRDDVIKLLVAPFDGKSGRRLAQNMAAVIQKKLRQVVKDS